MNAVTRRKKIIEILSKAEEAVSATSLAEKLDVSRQIIVTDIALLRAHNKNILSTNKGYTLFRENNRVSRIFHVKHSDADMVNELNTIIDLVKKAEGKA